MPLLKRDCPDCGKPVHTDCLIAGEHTLGCGKVFTGQEMKWLQNPDMSWEEAGEEADNW